MSWRSLVPARPRLGIRATVILPLVCASLTIAVLGMRWIEEIERDQRRAHLRMQAWTIGRSLASVASDPDHRERLTRLLQSFTAEAGVERVIVARGAPPRVVFSNGLNQVGSLSKLSGADAEIAALVQQVLERGAAVFQPASATQEKVSLGVPVAVGRGEPPGVVYVRIDAGLLRAAQMLRTRQLCLGLLAAVVLLALGTYVILRQTVLKPIEAISRFADRVGQGDRTARVSVSRHDELGNLARQIDSLVHELTHREIRERNARAESQLAREQSEATLAELASLKYALDQHAIISVVDRNGVFTHANNKFCETSKFRREDLAGKSHRFLDAGKPADSPWDVIWKEVSSGKVWRGEVCCKAADDSIFWVDNTIVPFRNTEGEITQHVVMGTDITTRKRAEEEILNERSLLAAFVEHAPAAIAMFDAEMRYLAVSRRYLTDYNLDAAAVIGKSHDEVFPNAPARWKEDYERGLTGATVTVEEDIWRPAGWDHDQHLHREIRPWRNAAGEIGGLMLFTEDLTTIKLTEAELRERKEQFELAVQGSNDGIWDWNVMTGEVFYSKRFKHLLGYDDAQFPHVFESLQSHLHADDAQATMDALQEHLNSGAEFDVVTQMRTASDEYRWFRLRGQAVRQADGRARRMAGSMSDVTSLKQTEEKLIRSAKMDQLTGLPNRTLFLDRLQQQVLRGRRSGNHNYAVMFLDFDRFKIVNDSLGHDAGDELLMQIAGRLREHIRSADSVACTSTGHTTARLGGDEFVILLTDLRDADDARVVSERLLVKLAVPYQIGKHEVYSTASIGIVVGSPNYARAEELVRDADTAMYEAKRNGKSRYVLFDNSMHDRVRRRMKLESELHRAIAENQLFLAYQPIYDLQTGDLRSVEALVRWKHPEEGLIAPGEFVPIAEESSLILALGDWVMSEACRRFAEWSKMLGEHAPPMISINISRKQFSLVNLPQMIQTTLETYGIDPSRIELEVTEDFFASDVKSAVRSMKAIKALGVRLAIDDFGTGCSSFASLHQFPADVLKIDRSLIAEVPNSEDAIAMIQGLTTIAKNLEVKIVAEGVETQQQAQKLTELGCDFAQGFYFARPMTGDQLVTMRIRQANITIAEEPELIV
jgi:diguanylate cyclase (GGDEF)-like protein/PAS domain S-box-containing protein